MTRQVLAIVAALTLVSGAAFASGDQEAGAEGATQTVTVWSTDPATSWKSAVELLTQKYPGVKVDILHIPWSNTGWSQKVISGMLSDDLPDLTLTAQGGVEWSVPVRGIYRPLNRFLEQDNIDTSDYAEALFWVQQYEGQAYALPLWQPFQMLYYNKTLLREAGLGGPPTTWDEMRDAVQKTTERDANGNLTQVGMPFSEGEVWIAFWLSNNWSANGYGFSRDGKTSTMNSPENVRAAEFYLELRKIMGTMEDIARVAPNIQGAADSFSLGKSAMTWVPAMLQLGLIQKYAPEDLDYGVGLMPAGPGGHQLIAQSGGPLLEIPAQARNPEGAWELIKILQSKEGQLAYVDDHWDTRATFPGRMSVAQSEEFRSRPGIGELVDLIDHVFPVGHAAHVFSTDDYYISGVVPAVDAFIYDKETPQAALDKATAAVQEKMDSLFAKLEERGLPVRMEYPRAE